MFTRQCTSTAQSELPCIDPQWIQDHPSYFTNKSMLTNHSRMWHPGRRITNAIYLDDVTGLQVEQLRVGLLRQHQRALELEINPDDTSTIYSDNLSHIATIFIYCPPCTCLIDTAVDVCRNMADPQLLRRLIRIEDRLPCSCFDPPLALEKLK